MSDPVKAEVAVANAQVPAVAHPATGEIIALDSPTDLLAAALLDSKDLVARAQSYSRAIKDELLRRMDYERTYTAHLRGLKVEGDGERAPDYDGEKLWKGLAELVPEVISLGALENAVERSRTYKAKKRGISKLLMATDERVLAAVEAARVENTKARDVRVTREA